ncbi:septum formation initiator family protein [Candidatus Babeliales bacterium]|nr:septum formation initiator family protein [Candidatus Babeliales bacterium]
MKRIQLDSFLYKTVLTVLVSVFFYFLIFSEIGFVRYLDAKKQFDCKQDELVALTTEIENLEQEIEDWKSDSFYLEKIARQELGMGRKGEVVYRRFN